MLTIIIVFQLAIAIGYKRASSLCVKCKFCLFHLPFNYYTYD